MMLRRKERSYNPLLCDEQQNFGEIVTMIMVQKMKNEKK